MKLLKLIWNILKDERGSTLAVTYSFSANTLMVASQMNTNFDDVESIVNALTSTNFANDSVGKAALASDVIRATYGLVQHTDGSLYIDVSDTNPCLELTDGGVRVKVDDSSIERVSGGLQVKALGVTNAMLAGSIADGKMVETYHTTSRHDADDHSAFNYATMGSGLLPASKQGPAFGAWLSRSVDTSYLAATDGFVCAIGEAGLNHTLSGFTDSSNPPTTLRLKTFGGAAQTNQLSIIMPVKKGDYWKITHIGGVDSIYWIPSGA